MRQLTENLLRARRGGDRRSAGPPSGRLPDIVRVCASREPCRSRCWKNPPPGGKMEAFERMRIERLFGPSPGAEGLESPLSSGSWNTQHIACEDLFDTFAPAATTDPRRLVEFAGTGRDVHCTVRARRAELALPVNP